MIGSIGATPAPREPIPALPARSVFPAFARKFEAILASERAAATDPEVDRTVDDGIRLANKIAAAPAQDLDELKFKALVVKWLFAGDDGLIAVDWTGRAGDTADMRLAASIVRDLLRLAGDAA